MFRKTVPIVAALIVGIIIGQTVLAGAAGPVAREMGVIEYVFLADGTTALIRGLPEGANVFSIGDQVCVDLGEWGGCFCPDECDPCEIELGAASITIEKDPAPTEPSESRSTATPKLGDPVTQVPATATPRPPVPTNTSPSRPWAPPTRTPNPPTRMPPPTWTRTPAPPTRMPAPTWTPIPLAVPPDPYAPYYCGDNKVWICKEANNKTQCAPISSLGRHAPYHLGKCN